MLLDIEFPAKCLSCKYIYDAKIGTHHIFKCFNKKSFLYNKQLDLNNTSCYNLVLRTPKFRKQWEKTSPINTIQYIHGYEIPLWNEE